MWQNELYKLMKPKEKEILTSIIANIVSISPFKISFFNAQCYAASNQIILTNTIQKLIDSEQLKSGDKVVILPYNKNQKFIIIDKVVA